MTLKLSGTQRIHLCRAVRSQSGDAGTLRTWWKLDDAFSLNDEEKATIKFQTRLVDMQEVYVWDASAELPEKEVVLEAAEVVRTKHALTTSIHRSSDRVWLEPLLAQLES